MKEPEHMKRIFYRFALGHLFVKIMPLGEKPPVFASVLDMSGSGISFTTQESVSCLEEEGNQVAISFHLQETPFTIQARLIRKQHMNPFLLFYACEWVEMDERKRASLIRHLFDLEQEREKKHER